ncbi:MAG TPA: hypothetical protein DHU96_21060 [Actinobacteria bacterium]|nr:hypothetical protein [Actinomycetota bacterium]
MNDHDRTLDPGYQPDPDLAPEPSAGLVDGLRSPGPAHPSPGWLDIDHLASLVRDRLGERVSQPAGARGEMPSVDEAVALREKAPELYDLWLRIAQDRAATGNYVQRAPYEVPERLAQSGRPRALSALVVVLAFCGYLAWLGGPGPYIAGLIAAFDLIAMLGLFFGLRPDHLSDSRHPTRKRLSAADDGSWGSLPSPRLRLACGVSTMKIRMLILRVRPSP